MRVVLLQATLIALCVTLGFASSRIKRKTGDQAPPGECMTFKWGGMTKKHWYVCCNNCNDTDTSCDGTTYHSASSGSYCNTCGTDNDKGNGNIHHSFECGGCIRQNIIQSGCTTNILSIFHIPGFCWAFTKCFSYFCSPSRKRSADDDIPDDMFNLVCDPGETVTDNPTDCCGTVNAKCNYTEYVGTNDCPPACCGDPSCCMTTGARTQSFGHISVFFPVLLLVLFTSSK